MKSTKIEPLQILMIPQYLPQVFVLMMHMVWNSHRLYTLSESVQFKSFSKGHHL